MRTLYLIMLAIIVGLFVLLIMLSSTPSHGSISQGATMNDLQVIKLAFHSPDDRNVFLEALFPDRVAMSTSGWYDAKHPTILHLDVGYDEVSLYLRRK